MPGDPGGHDPVFVWTTIAVVAVIVAAGRWVFLLLPRDWRPRGLLEQALSHAPLAALAALVAPQVLAPLLEPAAGSPAGVTGSTFSPPRAMMSSISDRSSAWYSSVNSSGRKSSAIDSTSISAIAISFCFGGSASSSTGNDTDRTSSGHSRVCSTSTPSRLRSAASRVRWRSVKCTSAVRSVWVSVSASSVYAFGDDESGSR